ncbi:uncharacterized protein B0I36DRAFT_328269 [Microdochium trichocladiopsis]|uniref:Uncharacterized protein n=1 Tax=Microdochium trichocladiopsis TaxID=1682393 RepID=A0A9P8Y4R9_9PEZI|nr:uncharacterized protein B0I36DRAFT_328269 [Microdochium trichocladiopsis]KAH7027927.1 hypothetical protein B0I36DRAFT_328269 [Microdochium trichocladiopsis]
MKSSLINILVLATSAALARTAPHAGLSADDTPEDGSHVAVVAPSVTTVAAAPAIKTSLVASAVYNIDSVDADESRRSCWRIMRVAACVTAAYMLGNLTAIEECIDGNWDDLCECSDIFPGLDDWLEQNRPCQKH